LKLSFGVIFTHIISLMQIVIDEHAYGYL